LVRHASEYKPALDRRWKGAGIDANKKPALERRRQRLKRNFLAAISGETIA
jgi:hypothetical protein